MSAIVVKYREVILSNDNDVSLYQKWQCILANVSNVCVASCSDSKFLIQSTFLFSEDLDVQSKIRSSSHKEVILSKNRKRKLDGYSSNGMVLNISCAFQGLWYNSKDYTINFFLIL